MWTINCHKLPKTRTFLSRTDLRFEHFSISKSNFNFKIYSSKETTFVSALFWMEVVQRWGTNHSLAMTCFSTYSHNRLHSNPAPSLKHIFLRDTLCLAHTETVKLFFLVSSLIYCGLTTHTATEPCLHVRLISQTRSLTTKPHLSCGVSVVTKTQAFFKYRSWIQRHPLRTPLLSYLHEISIILCLHECCWERTGDMHLHWHTPWRESGVEVNQMRAVIEIRGLIRARKHQLWI